MSYVFPTHIPPFLMHDGPCWDLLKTISTLFLHYYLHVLFSVPSCFPSGENRSRRRFLESAPPRLFPNSTVKGSHGQKTWSILLPYKRHSRLSLSIFNKVRPKSLSKDRRPMRCHSTNRSATLQEPSRIEELSLPCTCQIRIHHRHFPTDKPTTPLPWAAIATVGLGFLLHSI